MLSLSPGSCRVWSYFFQSSWSIYRNMVLDPPKPGMVYVHWRWYMSPIFICQMLEGIVENPRTPEDQHEHRLWILPSMQKDYRKLQLLLEHNPYGCIFWFHLSCTIFLDCSVLMNCSPRHFIRMRLVQNLDAIKSKACGHQKAMTLGNLQLNLFIITETYIMCVQHTQTICLSVSSVLCVKIKINKSFAVNVTCNAA